MKLKLKNILYFMAFALMIVAFIYLGAKDYSQINGKDDGHTFASDYHDVPAANNFDKLTASEVKELLKTKTGLIFFGSPSSKWSQAYARYLYEAAIDYDISKIYYYDITKDKMQNNSIYQDLLGLLKDQTVMTDEADAEIFTPCLLAVDDGQIIGYNNETAIISSQMEPKTYWTLSAIINFKSEVNTFYSAIK